MQKQADVTISVLNNNPFVLNDKGIVMKNNPSVLENNFIERNNKAYVLGNIGNVKSNILNVTQYNAKD